jgi:hypothetical protein
MTLLEMVTRKLAIRSAQRAPCQTAFVKRYEASLDFTFPEKFDLSRHNLLLLESIRSGKDTAVLLYWTSEERSRALEPVVEKALGISCAQVIGEVVQVLTPNHSAMRSKSKQVPRRGSSCPPGKLPHVRS